MLRAGRLRLGTGQRLINHLTASSACQAHLTSRFLSVFALLSRLRSALKYRLNDFSASGGVRPMNPG